MRTVDRGPYTMDSTLYAFRALFRFSPEPVRVELTRGASLLTVNASTSDYKSGAFAARPRFLRKGVAPAGFGPATTGVAIRRSIH